MSGGAPGMLLPGPPSRVREWPGAGLGRRRV